MKCVLHIGTEKTGTTLLQDWLYSSRRHLSAQGVCLSDVLGTTNNRLLPGYFQTYLDDWARLEGLRTLEDKDMYFEGFEDMFGAEIDLAAQTHDTFVISSEHLHSRLRSAEPIERLAAFLRTFFTEIHVICYVREQTDMALSGYSTWLRTGFTGTVEEALAQTTPDGPAYNLEQTAELWTAAFGKDACTFRIYDRSAFEGGDLRRDFLSVALPEIDLAPFSFDDMSRNGPLSAVEATVFRRLNAHIPHWDVEAQKPDDLNREIRKAVQRTEALREGRIAAANAEQVRDRFAASNARFLETYIGPDARFPERSGASGVRATFELDQVIEIVEALCDTLLPFAQTPPKAPLHDEDADTLRNLALRVENGRRLGLDDALALLELAQRARPHGKFIARKIEDISARMEMRDTGT